MNNKKYLTLLFCMAIAFILGIVPKNASSKLVTNVPADISGSELKAVVIEDFEVGKVVNDLDADGWMVSSQPKKYTKNINSKKAKQKNPVPILEMKFVQGKPNDLQPEKWSLTGKGDKDRVKRVLGVRFQFKYPGVNSVHILPPKERYWDKKRKDQFVKTYNPNTRKEEIERAIQIPGRAKGISLWVHGRGKPYFLEVWVKDYRGNTHILKFGSINFVGWRPMKVEIPAYIPQATETYPQTRGSKITRFVLRNDPSSTREEQIEETFVFFDQVKVLTDTYEVNFDGSDLDTLFKGGKSGSNNGGGGTR